MKTCISIFLLLILTNYESWLASEGKVEQTSQTVKTNGLLYIRKAEDNLKEIRTQRGEGEKKNLRV